MRNEACPGQNLISQMHSVQCVCAAVDVCVCMCLWMCLDVYGCVSMDGGYGRGLVDVTVLCHLERHEN